MDDFNQIIEYAEKLNVLYVEDEEEVRESTSKLLEMFFKNVDLAKDGKDGLNTYNEYYKKNNRNYDIVITDINMPVMDGLDMSKLIKEINIYQNIIVLTAYDSVEYLKKAIDINIDKFISKPILSAEKFIDTLKPIILNLKNRYELEKTNQFLENQRKMESLSKMLHNISHHWKQPLCSISALSSGIEFSYELGINTDEKIKKDCAHITIISQNLSKILDDFSIIYEDTNLKSVERSCTKDIVDGVIKSFEEELVKDIDIILNIDDDVCFDNKTLIKDIIYGLSKNSLESLHKSEDEKKYLFIKTYKENDNNIISIKDNGIGIEDESLDKICEPYFTTKHESFGTGLSLFTIYQTVCKYLGGTIDISNIEYEYNSETLSGVEVIVKF